MVKVRSKAVTVETERRQGENRQLTGLSEPLMWDEMMWRGQDQSRICGVGGQLISGCHRPEQEVQEDPIIADIYTVFTMCQAHS